MRALRTVLIFGGILYLLSSIGFHRRPESSKSIADFTSYSDADVIRPSYVRISSDPFQEAVKNQGSWLYKDATITPLAHFVITARAVRIKEYKTDTGAHLSLIHI